MAGLQRFITYIYKYQNDEKMENAGFAKIEIRNGICRIEVHIRSISIEQPEATVYLFARNTEIIQGIPVGSIAVSRGNGDVRYSFETKELSNFGKTMEDIEGIFIPLEETDYLASQWKEGKIMKNLFRIIEKNTPSAEEKAKEEKQKEEVIQEEKVTQKEEAGKAEQKEKNVLPKEEAKASNPKQPIQATELPQEEFFEETGWERIFRKLRLKLDVFFPFEGQEIECVRMQLSDLQEFPRKYWYIGNNSFLLHGFFNYRHVIFGEMEEEGQKRYFIGVPGVFSNQERVMAAMFGFPEFRTAQNMEYKTGNFGYWYRII